MAIAPKKTAPVQGKAILANRPDAKPAAFSASLPTLQRKNPAPAPKATTAAPKATTAAPKATTAATPAKNNAASTKAMVSALQKSLDSGTATGTPNARGMVRNPVPDMSNALHQKGELPRPDANKSLNNKGKNSPLLKKPPVKKKPPIENPELPPTGGTSAPPTGGTSASPKPYMNKDWSKVVSHYFPETEGMNDGGLVRGCGAAVKGGGRGKIV